MHPNTFYANHFNHEKRDEVFVVMSFAPEFDSIWTEIIEPAIRDDVGLHPNRVDFNLSGESIVHDILDGIAHARLVLAEISSYRLKDAHGRSWPQRNANVMWEVGIAHVMRLPDEVLLIRHDNDPSIFDLTQFRAFPYDQDDISAARKLVADLVKDRLRSIEQTGSDYVRRCAQSLDFAAWSVLIDKCTEKSGMIPPSIQTMGDAVGNMSVLPAITRLLEMGAITTSYLSLNPDTISRINEIQMRELMSYHITPLGSAIIAQVGNQMGMFNPEIMAPLKAAFENQQPK